MANRNIVDGNRFLNFVLFSKTFFIHEEENSCHHNRIDKHVLVQKEGKKYLIFYIIVSILEGILGAIYPIISAKIILHITSDNQ